MTTHPLTTTDSLAKWLGAQREDEELRERKADSDSIKRGAYDPVMTLGEIGRVLGITRGGAWMLYASAIRKLRRRPGALRQFCELVALREQERHADKTGNRQLRSDN